MNIIDNEGKGPIIDKVYDIKFIGIEQDNGIESKVYKSDAYKIVVQAPDDIIGNILVELQTNNIVHIHVKKNSNISLNKVNVSIYTPYVKSLDASSAAEIIVIDTFTSEMITLESTSGAEISGSFKALKGQVKSSSGSSMKLHFLGETIDAQSTSGSSIELTGLSKTSQFKASSGAHIDAEKFTTQNADAESSSGGEIEISSTQKASARASSGSSIEIYKRNNSLELIKEESSGGKVSLH
jgi:hypothetical protein